MKQQEMILKMSSLDGGRIKGKGIRVKRIDFEYTSGNVLQGFEE